jgi:hypothetical protein
MASLEQKKSIAGWNATHTKNIRAIVSKTAQKNKDKYEQ